MALLFLTHHMHAFTWSQVWILTGPTCSGKSQLALEWAERLGAEIVSMDSMALYRRMNIGTAKPAAADRQRVPHHLIDELEPWESASVAWWLQQAAACIDDIRRRGKQALLVGGTPLYLKALLRGLFHGPPADDQVRLHLTQQAQEHGSAFLHGRLAQVDALAAAKIHPNDRRRLIRALEVFELTGIPISTWQTQWTREGPTPHPPASPTPTVWWLDLPREELYQRINRRVAAMFAAGLVEEVQALRCLEKPLGLQARQALGYKEVLEHLEGRRGLDDTVALIQTRTRNFAKRQITWFRHLGECQRVTAELTRQLWHPKMEVLDNQDL